MSESPSQKLRTVDPPRYWKHKTDGRVIRATPWWEIPLEDTVLDLTGEEAKSAKLGDTRLKIGFLVQVGWLLENEHGMWLGVGMKAQEMFEVLPAGYKPEGEKNGSSHQDSAASVSPSGV